MSTRGRNQSLIIRTRGSVGALLMLVFTVFQSLSVSALAAPSCQHDSRSLASTIVGAHSNHHNHIQLGDSVHITQQLQVTDTGGECCQQQDCQCSSHCMSKLGLPSLVGELNFAVTPNLISNNNFSPLEAQTLPLLRPPKRI